jgi:uncharacterized membrane protein YhaH (DUF805 family)
MTYWYISAIRKYADFSGRARRKEYWYFILTNLLIYILLTITEPLYNTTTIKILANWHIGIISSLYALLTFCPVLAVTARRLHDTNRSGWWQLVFFIPVVGIIIMLILTSEDGNPRENQYGKNPKGRGVVVFY